jgi:hypothetical protein
VSVVRMLGLVAVEMRLTVDIARSPSLTRSTAREIESPGTKPPTETGTAAPTWLRLSDSVPVATEVLTGVVLSVKLP